MPSMSTSDLDPLVVESVENCNDVASVHHATGSGDDALASLAAASDLAVRATDDTGSLERPHAFRSLLSRLRRQLQGSLAFSPSTPFGMGVAIPLACLINHALFLYGQTQYMWRLTLQSDIDVWYNATGLEAKTAFYSLGLDRETHLQYHQDETIRSFTYTFAIHELWKAKGLPNTLLPRLAAGLLILFSGIWPHLKLCLLSLTWLFANDKKRRKGTLRWLSSLGKWSLADVLVVCVMVGVLNLDWLVDPTAIKNGFVYQVPLLIDIVKHMYSATDICSRMLKADCVSPPSTWLHAKCISCRNFIEMEFDHPQTARTSFAGIAKGVEESGSGFARLRVQGMDGIYAFSVAVVLSIILSLMVDAVDQRESTVAVENRSSYFLLQAESHDEEEQNDDLAARHVHRSTTIDHAAVTFERERETTLHPRCDQYWGTVVSSSASLMVLMATFNYTLKRRVTGAIPQLMHDVLGIAWDRQFSLSTLVRVTGAAGGFDLLLMSVFGIFVIVGPVLRVSLCLVLLSAPQGHYGGLERTMHHMITYIAPFCAYEILALACLLVKLLMPMTTSTIVNRHDDCAKVDDSGICLEVFFDLQSSFVLLICGGLLLVALSSYIHKRRYAD
jgi:hypothetical protein